MGGQEDGEVVDVEDDVWEVSLVEPEDEEEEEEVVVVVVVEPLGLGGGKD